MINIAMIAGKIVIRGRKNSQEQRNPCYDRKIGDDF